jgi:anti-sigma factor RsiW
MTTRRCERWRELMGLYVLDRLDPGPRGGLERHLDGCPDCRREVTELDGVASALATVDAARLEAIQEPSPRLEQRIVGRVRRSRRGERRQLWVRRLAPALAAGAAAAITAVSLISLDADPPAVPTEPVTFAQVAAGVDVEGELIAHTWGVEVQFVAEGLKDGQRYIARLESADGEMIGAGTFIGISTRPIVCKLQGAVLREDARAFVVTTPEGEVVMRAVLPEPL